MDEKLKPELTGDMKAKVEAVKSAREAVKPAEDDLKSFIKAEEDRIAEKRRQNELALSLEEAQVATAKEVLEPAPPEKELIAEPADARLEETDKQVEARRDEETPEGVAAHFERPAPKEAPARERSIPEGVARPTKDENAEDDLEEKNPLSDEEEDNLGDESPESILQEASDPNGPLDDYPGHPDANDRIKPVDNWQIVKDIGAALKKWAFN